MRKILYVLLVLLNIIGYNNVFSFVGCSPSTSCCAPSVTIVPKAGTQLPTSIAPGATIDAYYTITNNTQSPLNNGYVQSLPLNVTQVTTGGTYPDTCGATFNLPANGGSCTLQLAISGPVNACLNSCKCLTVCFPQGFSCGGALCVGTQYPLHVISITNYSNWISNLSPAYTVAQGNAYVLSDAQCPLFVSIFGSCFGPNPSSPYIIPQVPIENSYVDPYYGPPLNTPGPDGTTNIIYRLSDNDALVTIVAYPPLAAYLGYQSYVFTRETSNYIGVIPPYPRTTSPDPDRYEIFGSIGNDVNNVIVQNQYGGAPWGSVVMYITTSNTNLANALIANAVSHGISPNSIFVEPVGSTVITGNGPAADDMMTLMRYAVPEDSVAAQNWGDALSSNVLVYKVSNVAIPVSRFGANSYTPHIVNNSETDYVPSLLIAQQQLADLLATYLSTMQGSPSAAESTSPLTQINAQGIPYAGLVGSAGIASGTLVEGDNQDTSTYAALTLKTLQAEETAFIVGINHNVESLDNTRYISVDIYNTSSLIGIAGSAQTNPAAVGFDSGVLTGSVQAVLQLLGITIPPSDVELQTNVNNLYLTFIARDITNPTIALAAAYGINLMGTSLVPAGLPISIAERSYIVPGTTAGGNLNYMLYPMVIAAEDDFYVI